MSEKSIFIKNMVCDRCVLVVTEVVKNLGLDLQFIDMGKIVLAEVLTFEQAAQLERKLSDLGFELIKNKRSQLIEDIKICMIGFVNKSSAYENINLSESSTYFIILKGTIWTPSSVACSRSRSCAAYGS